MSLSSYLKQITPALSQYDPGMSAEGALDPLGLYPLADALATDLCPGVRERQFRPGFLVPMVVGAYALRDIDLERVAPDGTSNALQVFEWIVVLSLIEAFEREQPENLGRLPGRNKVSEAIRAGTPLSHQNYLKTPSVFGFLGVYRLLARTMFLLDEEGQRPGENALRLLKAWEADHPEIAGFSSEAGNDFSHALVLRVEKGLAEGRVRPGWDYGSLTARVFNPSRLGPHVKQFVWELLAGTGDSLRGEYAKFVVDYAERHPDADEVERRCHEALCDSGSGPMREHLTAIKRYERVCRLLMDAFNEIRFEARADRDIKAGDLARGPCVVKAQKELPGLAGGLQDALSCVSQAHRAEKVFALMEPAADAGEWAVKLVQHHMENQHRKPPNGKLPWIDCFDNGRLVTRPGYACDESVKPGRDYVHSYRFHPLKSFAMDLGRLS